MVCHRLSPHTKVCLLTSKEPQGYLVRKKYIVIIPINILASKNRKSGMSLVFTKKSDTLPLNSNYFRLFFWLPLMNERIMTPGLPFNACEGDINLNSPCLLFLYMHIACIFQQQLLFQGCYGNSMGNSKL